MEFLRRLGSKIRTPRHEMAGGLENVRHIKNNFLEEDVWDWFEKLKSEIPWIRVKWGRTGRPLPRLTHRVDSKADLTETLRDIAEVFEATFDCKIQGIWCNWYQSGSDWCPPHQDRYDKHVFTLSLGASRRCVVENIASGEKTTYLLENGDIFYFSPDFDAAHKHSIPKTAARGERISIVFFAEFGISAVSQTAEMVSISLKNCNDFGLTEQELLDYVAPFGITRDDFEKCGATIKALAWPI